MMKGKKTYLTGIGAILGAAAGFMQGSLELAEAIQLAITALLAMFVRSGIKSDTGN
jgi:hypothetical protein